MSTWAQWAVLVSGVLALVFGLRATALQREQSDQERTAFKQELAAARAEAAKDRFRPLAPDVRNKTAEALRAAAAAQSSDAQLTIEITYETWATAATREFAAEIATLLREAGFRVSGPEYATVFLVGVSFPLEWGYNEDDEHFVGQVFDALSAVIRPGKYAARKFERGHARIHFGGAPVFEADGTAVVQ